MEPISQNNPHVIPIVEDPRLNSKGDWDKKQIQDSILEGFKIFNKRSFNNPFCKVLLKYHDVLDIIKFFPGERLIIGHYKEHLIVQKEVQGTFFSYYDGIEFFVNTNWLPLFKTLNITPSFLSKNNQGNPGIQICFNMELSLREIADKTEFFEKKPEKNRDLDKELEEHGISLDKEMANQRARLEQGLPAYKEENLIIENLERDEVVDNLNVSREMLANSLELQVQYPEKIEIPEDVPENPGFKHTYISFLQQMSDLERKEDSFGEKLKLYPSKFRFIPESYFVLGSILELDYDPTVSEFKIDNFKVLQKNNLLVSNAKGIEKNLSLIFSIINNLGIDLFVNGITKETYSNRIPNTTFLKNKVEEVFIQNDLGSEYSDFSGNTFFQALSFAIDTTFLINVFSDIYLDQKRKPLDNPLTKEDYVFIFSEIFSESKNKKNPFIKDLDIYFDDFNEVLYNNFIGSFSIPEHEKFVLSIRDYFVIFLTFDSGIRERVKMKNLLEDFEVFQEFLKKKNSSKSEELSREIEKSEQASIKNEESSSKSKESSIKSEELSREIEKSEQLSIKSEQSSIKSEQISREIDVQSSKREIKLGGVVSSNILKNIKKTLRKRGGFLDEEAIENILNGINSFEKILSDNAYMIAKANSPIGKPIDKKQINEALVGMVKYAQQEIDSNFEIPEKRKKILKRKLLVLEFNDFLNQKVTSSFEKMEILKEFKKIDIMNLNDTNLQKVRVMIDSYFQEKDAQNKRKIKRTLEHSQALKTLTVNVKEQKLNDSGFLDLVSPLEAKKIKDFTRKLVVDNSNNEKIVKDFFNQEVAYKVFRELLAAQILFTYLQKGFFVGSADKEKNLKMAKEELSFFPGLYEDFFILMQEVSLNEGDFQKFSDVFQNLYSEISLEGKVGVDYAFAALKKLSFESKKSLLKKIKSFFGFKNPINDLTKKSKDFFNDNQDEILASLFAGFVFSQNYFSVTGILKKSLGAIGVLSGNPAAAMAIQSAPLPDNKAIDVGVSYYAVKFGLKFIRNAANFGYKSAEGVKDFSLWAYSFYKDISEEGVFKSSLKERFEKDFGFLSKNRPEILKKYMDIETFETLFLKEGQQLQAALNKYIFNVNKFEFVTEFLLSSWLDGIQQRQNFILDDDFQSKPNYFMDFVLAIVFSFKFARGSNNLKKDLNSFVDNSSINEFSVSETAVSKEIQQHLKQKIAEKNFLYAPWFFLNMMEDGAERIRSSLEDLKQFELFQYQDISKSNEEKFNFAVNKFFAENYRLIFLDLRDQDFPMPRTFFSNAVYFDKDIKRHSAQMGLPPADLKKAQRLVYSSYNFLQFSTFSNFFDLESLKNFDILEDAFTIFSTAVTSMFLSPIPIPRDEKKQYILDFLDVLDFSKENIEKLDNFKPFLLNYQAILEENEGMWVYPLVILVSGSRLRDQEKFNNFCKILAGIFGEEFFAKPLSYRDVFEKLNGRDTPSLQALLELSSDFSLMNNAKQVEILKGLKDERTEERAKEILEIFSKEEEKKPAEKEASSSEDESLPATIPQTIISDEQLQTGKEAGIIHPNATKQSFSLLPRQIQQKIVDSLGKQISPESFKKIFLTTNPEFPDLQENLKRNPEDALSKDMERKMIFEAEQVSSKFFKEPANNRSMEQNPPSQPSLSSQETQNKGINKKSIFLNKSEPYHEKIHNQVQNYAEKDALDLELESFSVSPKVSRRMEEEQNKEKEIEVPAYSNMQNPVENPNRGKTFLQEFKEEGGSGLFSMGENIGENKDKSYKNDQRDVEDNRISLDLSEGYEELPDPEFYEGEPLNEEPLGSWVAKKASKSKSWVSQNPGKVALGIGLAAGIGAGAYGLHSLGDNSSDGGRKNPNYPDKREREGKNPENGKIPRRKNRGYGTVRHGIANKKRS